jgi:hypothetical protein
MDIVDVCSGGGVWVKMAVECRYTHYDFCRSGPDCWKSAVTVVDKYSQLVVSCV